MNVARISIIFLAFVGTSFLGYEKDAMKATTVAGMSIMGIGMPIWWMTVWRVKTENRKGWRQSPLAFVVPFAVGWFVGISYYLQGEANSDRVTWCAAQSEPSQDCVTSQQGWTYKLNIGHYTTSAGDDVPLAYGRYLGTMLAGHGAVIVLFFLFFLVHQLIPMTPEVELEKEAAVENVVVEEFEKVEKVVTVVKV